MHLSYMLLTFLNISIILLLLLPKSQGRVNYCSQLTKESLGLILGQAFNPRYMSIEEPEPTSITTSDPETAYSQKRSPNDVPFYADTDIVSVGDFPAWDTNHLSYFEKKNEETLQRSARTSNTFVERISQKSEMFKSRPWECLSKVNWIDLGAQYFPRYIRSMECTSKKCWYGHFNCKPKSFTVKVLRRKSGSCIRISEKLVMITAHRFETDFTELWVWEERSVNFCCECVMLYQ